MDAVLFLVFAAIAVVCAVNLVLQRHPIASALSLIGVMGSLAFVFLQLGAEFLAAAQLVVYAGAIMVLFVFVIMLLNEGKERKAKMKLWVRWAGAPLLVLVRGADGFRDPHHPAASSQRALRLLRRRHRAARSAPGCSPRTCCPLKSPAS